MNQPEACDILFPAACGDLTLLLENITRFDEVFFTTLAKLRVEAEVMSDPRAANGVAAVTELVNDPRLLSLALIQRLFTSHDIDYRSRVCEKNAAFTDDQFFAVWRSEVTGVFERERDAAKVKHSRSRYNEALAAVRAAIPERSTIKFEPTFTFGQALYGITIAEDDSGRGDIPLRVPQSAPDIMSHSRTTDDYIAGLRRYAEAERGYPDFSSDPARFKRLTHEIFADFGWEEPTDSEIEALLDGVPSTFNSQSGVSDWCDFYLEVYRRLLPDEDRARLAPLRVVTLPIVTPNAHCIAAPNGEPVVVCYFGLLDILQGLTHAISSTAVDWNREEVFGDRARSLAQEVVRIVRGQGQHYGHELPFVGKIWKTKVAADLHRYLSTLEIYQTLFLIGHEIEHLRLGHLASAPRMAHALGVGHPQVEVLLTSRKAEFAADAAALQTLSSAHLGTDAFVAVDILFQYLDFWEDVGLSDLPTASDHPTAQERRVALKQTWPGEVVEKKKLPVGLVMAFLDSVRRQLLETRAS